MNHCFPDWNFEGDPPATNQKNMGADQELVELLWQNGQVVLHSQTHRKPNPHESRQVDKNGPSTLRDGSSFGNSSNLIQEDETVSWIHYPIEDPFEKEFCSHFFSELSSSDHVEGERLAKFDSAVAVSHQQQQQQQQPNNTKHPVVPEFSSNPMPPPRIQFPEQNHDSGGFDKAVNANFSQFSVPPLKGDLTRRFGGKGSGNLTQGEVRECSVMTVGSSNQIRKESDVSRASSSAVGTTDLSAGPLKEDVGKVMSQSERGKTETLEPTVTSSSGGSGSSFGRTCNQSTGITVHKRKSVDAEESECQSEAAELESAAANKPAKRSGSARRSRAAEVHNLSERRRRDRINEKMKALQELIPHCNKTDKASMLDEAIEYLKSLQLQLQVYQVMWMGSGMAPLMFPGVQHFVSRMGMGMGPTSMPSIHNPVHLSTAPLVDQPIALAPTQNQAMSCQNPMFNPVNQMQNPAFSDQYARFMGFHMQAASQPLNMFRFGSQAVQQSQMVAPPSNGGSASSGGGASATNDASQSGKMG